MPFVNFLNPDDLDRIHIQRMGHAQYLLMSELIDLDNPAINALLSRWSIAILPGRRVAIGYPPDVRQVLEKELLSVKAKREKERKAQDRFSKSDCCHRFSPGENHAPGCRGKRAKPKGKARR